MNNLVSRILLSVLLFPLGLLVFGSAVSVAGFRFDLPEEGALLFAGTTTMAFTMFYWLLLWRRAVDWTGWRVIGTVVAVLGSAALGLLFCTVLTPANNKVAGYVLGSLFAPMAWLIATVMIWRETQGERASRLRMFGGSVLVCPTCGYNLTGLYEARCPECGSKFTLDQLLLAHHRDQVVDVSASGEAIQQP